MPAPKLWEFFPWVSNAQNKAVRLGWDESAALILDNKLLLSWTAGMKTTALDARMMGRLEGPLCGHAGMAAGARGTEGSRHRLHPASQPRIPLQSRPKLDPTPGPVPPAASLDGSELHGPS